MIAPDSRESGGTRRGRVRAWRATPPRAKGGAEEECADQDEDDGDGEGARREGEGFEEDGGVGVVPRNLEDANHAEHLQHVAGDLPEQCIHNA